VLPGTRFDGLVTRATTSLRAAIPAVQPPRSQSSTVDTSMATLAVDETRARDVEAADAARMAAIRARDRELGDLIHRLLPWMSLADAVRRPLERERVETTSCPHARWCR
jgi:hypothetical protein